LRAAICSPSAIRSRRVFFAWGKHLVLLLLIDDLGPVGILAKVRRNEGPDVALFVGQAVLREQIADAVIREVHRQLRSGRGGARPTSPRAP
jgi:hypothetical protein